MEISSVGNSASAQKPSTSAPADKEGSAAKATTGPEDSSSSISSESQASPVPPANPTSASGNEPAAIPTAESQTGGQINISI